MARIVIGDGMSFLVDGLDSLTASEIKKRLRFLLDDELRLFSNTRDAGFEEYEAIERAIERNRKKQNILRERLAELT